jgi:hypothetical protein
MGYHYMNMANVADGVLDPTKPELLVYVPTEDGLRLAAAEYFQADADQNLAIDSDRPSLFGVSFDGPMPGSPVIHGGPQTPADHQSRNLRCEGV